MNISINNEQFTALISFLRYWSREDELIITMETLIEDDLGITGDDAEELILAFGEEFNVDVTNFNLPKYFYDEPGVFNLQNRIVEPFNVGHLVKAIVVGRLDDTVINS